MRLRSLSSGPRLHTALLLAAVLVASTVTWMSTSAHAGSLSGASVTLSDTEPDQVNTSYAFSFTVSSATVLQSFRAQICTAASGACVTPAGFSAASAVLASQPVGYGASSGWVDDSVTSAFQVYNSSNSTPPSGAQQLSFSNVVNPSGTGAFYARLSIYSDDAYTNVVDASSIAFVITPGISVSATVDPTLTFAVDGVGASTTYKGALATSDRCNDTASTITFGSPLQPLQPDTDYDCAQTLTTGTNGNGGYQVTIKNLGSPTLTSTSSSITDWSGTNALPSATPSSSAALFGYTTSDNRLTGQSDRFTSSDNLFAGLTDTDAEVAHATGPVAGDSVNIGYRLRFTVLSPAGTYTGKVVYTCTPNF